MHSPIRYLHHHRQFLGFHTHNLTPLHHRHHHSIPSSHAHFFSPRVCCSFNGREKEKGERVKANGKGKDNVWSIDNEIVKAVEEKERDRRRRGRSKKNSGGGKRSVKKFKEDSIVMVSGSMLMEVETVLETQEPVIRPAWTTFVSSVSGIWKGVGAVFSPINAEMEPVDTGVKNQYLYDCYTLSRLQAVQLDGKTPQIQRKINWVTLNPHGEKEKELGGSNRHKDEEKHEGTSSGMKERSHRGMANHAIPKFESFNFEKSDLMEEDIMGMEPGLVFFEDGSYSRGPVEIPVGGLDESKYYLSPTYKFEQCLVKGSHKRLRIVHTIEFSNGGTNIQILRVAVYEEQWVGPANIEESSEVDLDMNPFSQRNRILPSQLAGQWKVFEMSATPIYGDEAAVTLEETTGSGPPYVHLCMETLKKRSLPDNPTYFGEEEMHDMQDVTILWLPGGVTAYVDVKNDGILCIGVGWYSDDGVHIVMERDYDTDGRLREVRYNSEVKRRWSDPLPV